MKFKLQRQKISKELLVLGSNKIKKDRIFVPRASKRIINGMPAILQQIQERGLPDYLVIKKLKGKLGHGIFLHPKAKPILKGEPIAPYSGIVSVSPQNIWNDSSYVFSLISDFSLTKEEHLKWDPKRRYHPRRLYSIDLDAHKEGNFTRFINHSEKPNIEAVFVKIPSNSLGLQPAPFELIYIAKKTIHPGEQLLVCYEGQDKSYWGPLNLKPFPMTPRTFMLDASCKIVDHS